MARRPAIPALLAGFTFRSLWADVWASQRLFTDPEVADSLKPYINALRDNFNKADATSLANAYLVDASMLVKLGPEAAASSIFKPPVKLVDNSAFRDRDKITQFWHYVIHDLDFKSMRAYELEGEYAATIFPVDDDTVVVTGAFTFGSAASGKFLSQTWVRNHDASNSGQSVWQIRSDLVSIDTIDEVLLKAERHQDEIEASAAGSVSTVSPASQTTQPPSESGVPEALQESIKAVETVAEKAEQSPTASPTAPPQPALVPLTSPPSEASHTVTPSVETPALVTVAPTEMPLESEFPTLDPALYQSKEQSESTLSPQTGDEEESDASTTPAPGRHSFSIGVAILWMIGIVSGCFWFFYVYRAKRRREKTTIGGPDMLLG